jgi:hypothetical protein
MASRSEARIFASIWKDAAFVNLPRSAQGTYFFLLSQPDLSYCGVLSLRERRWVGKANGLTLEQLREDLDVLANATPEPFGEGFGEGFPEGAPGPFIVIDEESGELLVRSLIRHDGIWKQPNLLKAAREAADLVESPVIRAVLLEELRRIPVGESSSSHVRAVMTDFIDDLQKGLPKGSGNPPPKGSANPSGHPSDDPSLDPSQGKGGCNGGQLRVPPTPETPSPGAPAQARATLVAVPSGSEPRSTILGNGLLEEHIQACTRRPPRDVLRRTGDRIDALLDEGLEPDEIRAGLTRMRFRNLGPSLLAELVHEAAVEAGQQGSSNTASRGNRPASGRRSGANVHHEHDAGAGIAEGF